MTLSSYGTKVPSRGNPRAKIMVVGEAPGANEVRIEQPFVGAAGQILEEMFLKSGIQPSEVYYANICKYRPPDNEIRRFFNDQGVPNEAVLEGLTELRDEIAAVDPVVIVPLGNYPMRFLTGKGRWSKANGYTGIGDYRGSILEGVTLTGNRKCVPTYHPASILRDYASKPIVQLDLRRAAEQSGFREIRRPRKAIIIDPRGAERDAWAEWLVSSPGSLSPLVHLGDPETEEPVRLPSGDFLTGDIEYPGNRLSCIGYTRHRDAAVVFATRDDGDISFVRAIIESGVPLCFQNGMFDCSILEWHYGIECMSRLLHDPMAAMHCAYTEFPKDLGFLGSVFTEQPNWKDMVDWKAIVAGTQPYETQYHYNGIDVWVTHAVMEDLLADELQDSAIMQTYRFEMSLMNPLWQMSKRGVKMDVDGMEKLKATLEDEILVRDSALAILNGGKPLNVKSGPQVATFLYETLGVPKVGGKTATNQWKMDDATLASIIPKCREKTHIAAIRLVRETRERRDLISKFCEIELDADKRIRCHYDPTKTQTGRLSSKKFYPTGLGSNLQNPARDSRVRSKFVADRGRVLGYADLKSAESLVVAHITGDQEMLRLHSPEYLAGGLDGHKYVASFLLDKPIENITKDERYLGKKVRHACNYSMGPHKLMQNINADAQETGVSVNLHQAKLLVEKYRALHPMLPVWWRSIQLQLFNTRRLETIKKLWIPEAGIWQSRPHIFYDRPDSILPEAIAFVPQGTVADTLNIGLLRCAADEELAEYGFELLLQVHDAILYQCYPQYINAVNRRVEKLLTVELLCERKGVEPYRFTIPVEIAVGENWAEHHPEKNPNGLQVWHGDSD